MGTQLHDPATTSAVATASPSGSGYAGNSADPLQKSTNKSQTTIMASSGNTQADSMGIDLEETDGKAGESSTPSVDFNRLGNMRDRPQEFTYFSKMPIELRLRTWRYASYFSREVDIHVHRGSSSQTFMKLTTSRSPPAILHVNREAREEGLKH